MSGIEEQKTDEAAIEEAAHAGPEDSEHEGEVIADDAEDHDEAEDHDDAEDHDEVEDEDEVEDDGTLEDETPEVTEAAE